MNLKEYEQIFPHCQAEGLLWHTPNSHCQWRIDTLLTKEPDTIAWINTMKEGDVLFDVGANMGQYSLLAAKRGVKVHAFEPESQNFALLCKNIAINKMDKKVTPWPLALTDRFGPDSFFVTQLTAGNSCNSFGESVNYHLEQKQFAFTQGCYGVRLDFIASELALPTHIKIDVDGFEHKVIKGAEVALGVAKSVLIEINTALPEHLALIEDMKKFGLYPDLETAEQARRKDGPFKGIGNYIFYRDEADFLSKITDFGRGKA